MRVYGFLVSPKVFESVRDRVIDIEAENEDQAKIKLIEKLESFGILSSLGERK